MIYVSSYCIRTNTIKESVTALAESGFKNIELSGGTKYYPGYEDDLLELQGSYDINYLIHNYFPPSPKPFVLNLASLEDEIYEQSVQHCKRAIKLSRKLGGRKYGIHAGFLIDIKPTEAGNKIAFKALSERKTAIDRFKKAWKMLNDEANGNPSLYIENNVFSHTNVKTFKGANPFLFIDYKGYLELMSFMEFRVLLDLAHLQVSANSLGLNFKEQAQKMLPLTDYIHISDNDSLHDQNKGLSVESNIFAAIEKYDLNGKTITLEVYEGVEELIKSFNTVKEGIL